MLWEEVFLPVCDNALPGDYSWDVSERAKEFTIKHRLCVQDVNRAGCLLVSENRTLPNGSIVKPRPDGETPFIPMGELYENMRTSGALQCVKASKEGF